jgi:hypothetical protein
VAAQRQARRVFIVVDQGSLPRVSAAVGQSLVGTRGLFDDLEGSDEARNSLSIAEALDVLRGNDSLRQTLVQRRCGTQQPSAECRAVVPAAKAVIQRAEQSAEQSLRSVARAIEPAMLRTNGIEAIAKATGATVVSIAPMQDTSIASVTRALLDRLPAAPEPGNSTTTFASTSISATDVLTQLVERAASHVRSFVEAATVLVADEHYVQELKARSGSTSVPSNGMFGITVERRVLDSEVALVHIIDRQLWMMGRDVLAVDNRKVDDAHRVPLASYHPSSMAEAVSYFQQLATQGARFNIGRMTRNINVPTLALWFLTDGVRERFTFSLSGSETIDGQMCRIVQYRERKSPYLLTAEGRDVPARGRYWIEPDTGRVRKTELVLFDEESTDRINSDAGRATITARYAYTSNVDAWVPIEMQERYDYPKMMNADFIVGQAQYKNYRKFETSSRILP